MTLRFTRVSGSGEGFTFEEGTLPVDITRGAANSWTARGTIALKTLRLEEGDTLVYQAAARDLKPGADPSLSESFLIEIGKAAKLLRSYGVHRFTAHTLVDERELKDEFDRIRRDSYSLDAEESALEGCCFGAPIRDASGAVYAALSLSMPKSRMKPAALRPRVIAAVRRAADRISSAK